MGDIVSGIIGGLGAKSAAKTQAKAETQAADKAAATARLGFDFGAASPLNTSYGPTGAAANTQISQLLGVGGAQPDNAGNPNGGPSNSNAFNNYLNSTGYKFQLGQGLDALTSNNATKGLLNSDAALKNAQTFGQGLAGNYFQNYLSSLGGLSTQGQNAYNTITSAGSQAGATGAGVISNGYSSAAQTNANGTAGLLGGLAQAGQGIYNAFTGYK